MDSFERYVSGLQKSTNNLREGKVWTTDPDLFDEYIRQLEWMSENIGRFLQEAPSDEKKAQLLHAYSDFAKAYAFFLRLDQEKKQGKVCQCGSKSKYSCPRDPEFPCYFPA